MKEELSETELVLLKEAKTKLEHPSVLIELSNIIGKPIEKIYSFIPAKVQDTIGKITKNVLLKSLSVLVSKTGKSQDRKPKNMLHKVLVTGTGAAGGFFGLTALAIELPVTTAIMLRSIIDIAGSKGFDVNDIDTKLACLEVFALGGNSKSDDYSDSAYYLIRGTLAKEVADAGKYILKKGIINESAPAIVSYISKIASRFGVIVSEEVAAKSVPIIGSVSGGTINLVFMNHFQKMAEGHFTVMKLERKYGKEKVMEIYKGL
ncbi:MAG: EcsC family protein [Ignavibacteria bacterium]